MRREKAPSGGDNVSGWRLMKSTFGSFLCLRQQLLMTSRRERIKLKHRKQKEKIISSGRGTEIKRLLNALTGSCWCSTYPCKLSGNRTSLFLNFCVLSSRSFRHSMNRLHCNRSTIIKKAICEHGENERLVFSRGNFWMPNGFQKGFKWKTQKKSLHAAHPEK